MCIRDSLRPDYVMDKFYPKFEYSPLQINNLEMVTLKPDHDVHIKVTRSTEYGDRYKLFVIKKGSFNDNYFTRKCLQSIIHGDYTNTCYRLINGRGHRNCIFKVYIDDRRGNLNRSPPYQSLQDSFHLTFFCC